MFQQRNHLRQQPNAGGLNTAFPLGTCRMEWHLGPNSNSWLTANLRLLQQSLMMMTLMTIRLVDNFNISLFHDSPINFSESLIPALPGPRGHPAISWVETCPPSTQPTVSHHDLMAKQIVYHLFKLRNLYGTDRPRKTHL